MIVSQKASQVDKAYGELKADILANRLPPGFQAPEPEFATRLGMSRTPVREALLRLQSDGLVELVPRRGARVLPISVDDMREIYQLLISLESDAAYELAARGLTDQEIERLTLTAGVAVGGALTALAPVLAALGAMAALLKQVKVEIVRTDQSDDDGCQGSLRQVSHQAGDEQKHNM